MTLQEYLDFWKLKYTAAELRQDYDEALRLCGVLKDTVEDHIVKLIEAKIKSAQINKAISDASE